MKKVVVAFGTRPEVIKLAPVIEELGKIHPRPRVETAFSGQHADLVRPIADLFKIRIDHDLRAMDP